MGAPVNGDGDVIAGLLVLGRDGALVCYGPPGDTTPGTVGTAYIAGRRLPARN